MKNAFDMVYRCTLRQQPSSLPCELVHGDKCACGELRGPNRAMCPTCAIRAEIQLTKVYESRHGVMIHGGQ